MWLSLCFLVHELATHVVPWLFALSITTFTMGARQLVLTALGSLYRSRLATPARVVLRFTLNLAFLLAYVTLHPFFTDWPPVSSQLAKAPSKRC